MENSDHAELEGAISVPEVHARRRILQLCGLDSCDYHVVFTESVKVRVPGALQGVEEAVLR